MRFGLWISLLCFARLCGAQAGEICPANPKSQSAYLDPTGDPSQELNSDYFRICDKQVLRQRQIEHALPKSCSALTDTYPLNEAAPGKTPLFDVRRCLATSVVQKFTTTLEATLSPPLKNSAWHHYTAKEMQSLLKHFSKDCKTNTLYERYLCIEQNAEKFFKTLRAANAKFRADKTTSMKSVCDTLGTEAMKSVDLVAQNQFRPPELSAKDYPAYLECRNERFNCSHANDEPLGSNARECLLTALGFLGEDSDKYKASPIDAPGAFYLSKTLAELRFTALELSVFSRLCQTAMNPSSVGDGTIAAKLDAETKRRCLWDDVLALKAIGDFSEWIKQRKKQPIFDDSELKKFGIKQEAVCETPPDQTRQILKKSADQSFRIVKALPFEPEAPNAPEPIKYEETKKPVSANKKPSPKATLAPREDGDLNPADPSKAEEENELLEIRKALSLGPVYLPEKEEVKKEAPTSTPTSPPMPSTSDARAPLRIRSEQELVQQAQQALKEYKHDKAYSLDLGQFLIETELAESRDLTRHEQFDQFSKLWDEKLALYQKNLEVGAKTNDEKMQTLLETLHEDYFKSYIRENAKLTDFLRGQGGDCEAETKLLASSLQRLKLSPDAPWKIAAQVYDDHIQLVAYNPESKEVWNLLNGANKKGVEAPLYDPLLLVKGYLDGKKIPSPVSDQDLLIASADPGLVATNKNKGAKLTTNSGLSLPKPGIKASVTGEVPAVAKLEKPAPRQAAQASQIATSQPRSQNSTTPQNSRNSTPLVESQDYRSFPSFVWDSKTNQPIGAPQRFRVLSSEEIQKNPKLMREYGPATTDSKVFEFVTAVPGDAPQAVLFRSEEEKKQFLSLASDEDRRQYLSELREKNISEIINQPDFETLLAIQQDPYLLAQHTDDLDRLSTLAEQINSTARDGGAPYWKAHFIDIDTAPHDALLKKSPRFRQYFENGKALTNKLTNDPTALIQFFDKKIRAEDLDKNLNFLTTIGQTNRGHYITPIYNTILHPDHMTFSTEKKRRDEQKAANRSSQFAELKKEAAKAGTSPADAFGDGAIQVGKPMDSDIAGSDDASDPQPREQIPTSAQKQNDPVEAIQGKKAASKVRNPVRAKHEVSPELYAKLLLYPVRIRMGRPPAAEHIRDGVLKNWTPDLTKALLETNRVDTDDLRIVRMGFYEHIARQRPKDTLKIKGPYSGELIPEDIAKLFQLSLTRKLFTLKGLGSIQDEFFKAKVSEFKDARDYLDYLNKELGDPFQAPTVVPEVNPTPLTAPQGSSTSPPK